MVHIVPAGVTIYPIDVAFVGVGHVSVVLSSTLVVICKGGAVPNQVADVGGGGRVAC